MDKERDGKHLIGETIANQYKIKELIRPTTKSWVFKAKEEGEISPRRDVALKILQPNQGVERETQFKEEVDRLANLEHHPNITTVYSAGKDKKLGLFYVAIELVPGPDLDQEIKAGEKFSLEEILNIMTDVADAVNHIYEKEGGHHDIKLKNIKRKEEGKKTKPSYVLDLGGRLREVEASNDIFGMGSIFKELLSHRENPNQKIPSGLESIIEKSTTPDNYSSPESFKNAIENYRNSINRRKFLKTAGGAVALAGLGYIGFKHWECMNSIDYVVGKIAKTEASDYKKIEPFFKELAFKIFDQKIRWLKEEKIPKGKFPYATTDDGSWFNVDGTYWTSGFWPGILWRGFEKTKDSEFKEWALDWVNTMPFTEKDNLTTNPIRFYYSHALGYNITKDEKLLNTGLKAADLIAKRFNKNGGFIQTAGEIIDSDKQRIYVDVMTTALPLLLYAYQQTHNSSFKEIIIRHCDATSKFNINKDGSTIQLVEFNSKTMNRIKGIKSYGFNEDSCLSRGQARAIKGFAEAHKTTKDKKCLERSERCARYFIDNLPKDNIPFYDFKDSNKNIPKDSSAAAIASSGLLDLFNITSKTKYKLIAYDILKSLSTKCLSKEKDYQGLLLHGCSDKNKAMYINNSLIYGDYFFIETLNKI